MSSLNVFSLFADLYQLEQVGRVSLDRLYSHVVVHSLFHKRRLCEGLRVITNVQRIELFKVREMVQHVRLVVTQVSYRIVAVVRVEERCNFQTRQSVQIQ